MLGLMYRSRVLKKSRHIQNSVIGEVRIGGGASVTGSTADMTETIDSGEDSDDDHLESMNSKQQLARTIRNWSVMPENDDHIIQEGAVHALIALTGVEDTMVRKCCASALFNLSSRKKNRHELIALGAATGAITLSMGVKSWYVMKIWVGAYYSRNAAFLHCLA